MFRCDIEGLRGVAICLVVAFHGGLLRGGFIGVDVFFVLSGYLITGLLVQEAEKSGRVDLVRFYARRARRLLPACVLMVLATITAGAFVFSPLEQVLYARTALATSLYASNFWFIRETSNYFWPTTANNPFLHTWSLAVEEQFYLVWPLLVAVSLRRASGRRVLLWVMAVVSAASVAAMVRLTASHQPWAFYASPLRAWEFGFGGLGCLVPMGWVTRMGAWRGILPALGLGAILASAAVFDSGMQFPGAIAVIPVAGTVAVLIAGAAGRSVGAARVLDTGLLQYLGRWSYSWYLWHWPALLLASAAVPGLSTAGRWAALLAALGVAAGTHALIENPIRFSRYLMPRPAVCLALAALVTLAGFTSALTWRRAALAASRSGQQQAYAKAASDRSWLLARGCMTLFDDARPRVCSFGDPSSPTTLVLFGDSHADQWFPALEQVAQAHRWRLITLVKASCPAASVPVFNPRLMRVEAECSAWRQAALRRIVSLGPVTVVISNSAGYVRGGNESDWHARLSYSDWEAGMRQTLAVLDSAGARTLLVRDSPWPGFDVPACLSRVAEHRWYPAGTCEIHRSLALDPEVFHAEQRAARGLRGVSVLDLTEHFCLAADCAPVEHGVVVYSDTNHLTASFVKNLAPVIERRLVPLVGNAQRRL